MTTVDANDNDQANGGSTTAHYAHRRIRSEDWPWIWVIEDEKQLDWQLHLRAQIPDEETYEKEEQRILREQETLPVKLMDGLYISDAHTVAVNAQKLREELGVTHILNVGGRNAQFFGYSQKYYENFGFTYKLVDAVDIDGYPLLDYHWKDCQLFLEQAFANNPNAKVVVHCAAGINRSGLIATAYYMTNQRVSVLEAVYHCRKCRGPLLWNKSFQQQLVALAREEGLLGPPPGSDGCTLVKNCPPSVEEKKKEEEKEKPERLFFSPSGCNLG